MTQSKTLAQLSEGHDNNLNFLRFALASLVVLSHSFALPGLGATEPLRRITHNQIDGGSLAVDFFFLISGFLVTQSWQRSRTLADYLRKRILRIYPGYVVVVVLCALVVGPLGADSTAAYWQAFHPIRFLYNTAQLQFLLPPTFTHLTFASANGSLWTIRNEFLCYLLVAGLGLMGWYSRRGIVLGLFGVMLLLYAREVYAHSSFLPGRVVPVVGQLDMWPHYLTQYLAGMCFFLYRDRIVYTPRAIVICVGLLVAACFLHLLILLLPLCGAFLLFAFAFSSRPDLHQWAKRGDLSYGIYLYAFPLQQLLLRFLPPHLPPLVLFGLAFPLSLICAWGSWHLVEHPFLRLKATLPQHGSSHFRGG